MRLTALILAASALVHAVPQKGGRPHEEEPPPPPHLPEVAPPAPVSPGHQTPQEEDPYLPAPEENPCFSEGPSCDEIADVADEVLSHLLDLTQLISGPSSSSSTGGSPITAPLPNPATPTLLPVYEVAQSASIDPDLLGVLDSAEISMYASDPLCFFAHLERRYLSAATATATATSSSSSSSSSTPVSATASPTLSTTIIDIGFLTQTAVYSVIPSSRAAEAQTYLFESLFPYWVGTIFAPVTRTEAGTGALVTSTTTCAALDGAEGFTMPFLARAGATTVSPGGSNGAMGSTTTTTSKSTGGAEPTGVLGRGAAVVAGIVGIVALGAI